MGISFWGSTRKASSVPSIGHLAGWGGSGWSGEVPGLPDRGSQACFSPVFDLELDTRANTSSNHPRSFSHQQLDADAPASYTLLQQLLALCRCSSPSQAQLLQQVQRLRSEACAANTSSSTAAGLTAAGCCANAAAQGATPYSPGGSATNSTGCSAGSAPSGVAAVDVEAIACELLALGYMVQVRDGAAQQERSKNPRSCLQSLRHRFIVCLGVRSAADGEPAYLPEPLVVEPRFREQFTIAHSTPEYEALLQSLPACWVGPVPNLEEVVKLVAQQIAATFKLQGLPVPPWRTRTALLSKWGPQQLSELAAKIANLRRLAAAVPASTRAFMPCQSHEQLYNSDRPAAAHADHAAVGSAPSSAAPNFTAMQPAPAHIHLPAWDFGVTTTGMQQGGVNAAAMAAVPVICSSSDQQQQQQQQQQQHHDHQQQTNTALGCCAEPGIAQSGAVLQGACAACDDPSAAVTGVLAMLASSSLGTSSGSSTLRFTRNASTEWKHHRSSSRTTKGLLAAAFSNKPKVGSRGNLLMMVSSAAELPVGQAAAQPSGGVQQANALPPVSGVDAPHIRRTQFRAACDEPWRCITTVRLGACIQQQNPAATQP